MLFLKYLVFYSSHVLLEMLLLLLTSQSHPSFHKTKPPPTIQLTLLQSRPQHHQRDGHPRPYLHAPGWRARNRHGKDPKHRAQSDAGAEAASWARRTDGVRRLARAPQGNLHPEFRVRLAPLSSLFSLLPSPPFPPPTPPFLAGYLLAPAPPYQIQPPAPPQKKPGPPLTQPPPQHTGRAPPDNLPAHPRLHAHHHARVPPPEARPGGDPAHRGAVGRRSIQPADGRGQRRRHDGRIPGRGCDGAAG